MKIFFIIAALCTWSCVVLTVDENGAGQLPKSVEGLKQFYDVVNNLEKRGILNTEIAKREKQLYLEHATTLLGRSSLISLDEFLTWERRQSVVSFSNIIGVLAGITVFLAVSVLVTIFVFPLLLDIPPSTWEKVFYGISLFLMFLTSHSWLVFFGCLVFLASICFTFKLHHSNDNDNGMKMSWICCLTWTFVALYQQNQEAAYLAVMALESGLGFAFFVGPLSVAIGFQNEKVIPSGTASSLILVLLGAVLHLGEKVNILSVPFTRPLIFIGAFVYFIGLLILSSGFYTNRENKKEEYWLLQGIMFVSGLAAIFFGPLLGIPFIQGIGGTMFVFWLLQKYVELMNWKDSIRVAANLLGFGILLYLFASFLRSKPEFFIFHSSSNQN